MWLLCIQVACQRLPEIDRLLHYKGINSAATQDKYTIFLCAATNIMLAAGTTTL